MNLMSPTFAPASPAIIAALVGWLMVRVGEGKRMRLQHVGADLRAGVQARTKRGETVLSGELVDRAALRGVLAHIDQLGLELLDVHSNASEPPEIDTRRSRDTSPNPKET
jgi:hypothetical protein